MNKKQIGFFAAGLLILGGAVTVFAQDSAIDREEDNIILERYTQGITQGTIELTSKEPAEIDGDMQGVTIVYTRSTGEGGQEDKAALGESWSGEPSVSSEKCREVVVEQ